MWVMVVEFASEERRFENKTKLDCFPPLYTTSGPAPTPQMMASESVCYGTPRES